jgi:hypothetical protein
MVSTVIANVQEMFGHANITTPIYDRRKTRQGSPTFRVD